MRGRKPKPAKLRLLEGNPGKRRVIEVATASGVPDVPGWLDDEAKAEWTRIVPILTEMRLLAAIDRGDYEVGPDDVGGSSTEVTASDETGSGD